MTSKLQQMKFALLVYWDKVGNIGEYIQSLAALPFLPNVDSYLNKKTLSAYSGDTHKLIVNGWFMHYPGNWPPSKDIDPLITSYFTGYKSLFSITENIGCN